MEKLIVMWVVVGAGLIYFLFFAGRGKKSQDSGEEIEPEEGEAPMLAVTTWGGVYIESNSEGVVLCVLPSATKEGLGRIVEQAAPKVGIDAVVFIPAAARGGYMWASAVLEALAISADVPLYTTSDDALERWPDGGEVAMSREVERLPGKVEVGTVTLRRLSDFAIDAEWELGEHIERARIGVGLAMKLAEPYPNVVVGTMTADESGAPALDALLALREVSLLRDVPGGNTDADAQFWSQMGKTVTVFSDEKLAGSGWVEAAAKLVEIARDEDAADDALEAAIEEAGTSATVKALMNLCALGDLDIADAIASRATEVHSDQGELWFQRGVAAFMGGRISEAREHYQRALDVETPEPRALCNLAAISVDEGDLDGAVDLAKRAHVALPDDSIALQQAIVTMGRAGDIDGATELLEQSGDQLEKTTRMRLEVALEQGAEGFGGPVVHNFPLHAEMMVGLATELMNEGEPEAAVNALRRALELEPSNLAAIADLGVVLSGLDRDDEAIATYTKAIESVSGGELLRFNRGNATRRIGKLDEAVADYRRCLELAPRWVEVRVNLIATLQMKGEVEKAGAELDELAGHDVAPDLLEQLRENLDQARN